MELNQRKAALVHLLGTPKGPRVRTHQVTLGIPSEWAGVPVTSTFYKNEFFALSVILPDPDSMFKAKNSWFGDFFERALRDHSWFCASESFLLSAL